MTVVENIVATQENAPIEEAYEVKICSCLTIFKAKKGVRHREGESNVRRSEVRL